MKIMSFPLFSIEINTVTKGGEKRHPCKSGKVENDDQIDDD